MMQPQTPSINKYTTTFTYREKKISVNFYVNKQDGAAVDTVLFLGTGQVGKIPRWVAAHAPAGVVVVEGLPHWESAPNGSDLVAFSNLYTRSAYDAILKTFKCTNMHVIASSQAAPSVLWLVSEAIGQVHNVAFILPMGFNTEYFGMSNVARFKELRKRALLTILQKDQSVFSDIRNMYISFNLMRIILAGISDGSTVKKYTVGISENMTEVLRKFAVQQKRLGHQLTIYVGARDKVFPPHEVRQTLSDADICDVTIITVPDISHASLATRRHQSLLAHSSVLQLFLCQSAICIIIVYGMPIDQKFRDER